MPMRWSPERLDQLERAVRDGRRLALRRRGTEYVVLATGMRHMSQGDVLVGRLPMTGEELEFVLGEIEQLEIL